MGCLLNASLVVANPHTYTTKVMLDEYASEERAIRAAFVQVITELTASVGASQSDNIAHVLPTAAEFVSHIASLKADDERQMLQIRFDQTAIDQLLSQIGLPIWRGERANLVAWLVIERHGMQELLGDDGQAEAVYLREQTELRGIPLVLPLMDLTDQSLVSVSDIGGRFWQPIELASQRYQAQGIIIGRIYQTMDGYWHAQGQLKLPDGTQSWQLQAPDLQSLQASLAERVGAMLVQRYALQTDTSTTSQLFIQVHGIDSIQHYADLLAVMAKVSSVTQVEVHSLQADTLVLRLTHQGEAKKLLLSLELESRLGLLDGQQANAYSASQSAHTAYYVWQ